ncbi:MAG TPA: DUF2752 domain-containing protein [Anaeromyxobacteraceae bacterium]|nr:DUF2752 domain-containing protein [Anaeromyxobacteraceae bacterium]
MGRGPGGARALGIPEAFAALAVASFVAARFLPVLEIGLECPFKAATGLPCASCGMTHAFVALARGDVAGAWTSSPLGALLAGGAWLYALLDLVRLAAGRPWPVVPQPAWRALAVAAVGAAALNWAWMLLRAGAA